MMGVLNNHVQHTITNIKSSYMIWLDLLYTDRYGRWYGTGNYERTKSSKIQYSIPSILAERS